MKLNAKNSVSAALLLSILCCAAGCCNHPEPGDVPVPAPINLMLPRDIHIHALTEVAKADGGGKQIHVTVDIWDSFGDATKAFGQFRFELYRFKEASTDPKGELLQLWDIDIADVRNNAVRWDSLARAYKFHLKCDKPLPGGTPFVLAAVFSSRFTERLFDERTIETRK